MLDLLFLLDVFAEVGDVFVVEGGVDFVHEVEGEFADLLAGKN